MIGTRLRTEYLVEPLGLDIVQPRLFWNCEGGVQQTAYHIIAEYNGQKLWDSGKVASSQMAGISWGGTSLSSRDRVQWQVRLWDENELTGEWSKASFEMGLLKAEDWQAQWITGDYRSRKKERYPVDCFRRRFTCGEIERARLYITACGLYEARLNGERAGAFIMAPGFTDYNKRVQYQTYDVTDLLQVGENVLVVELSDGWYRGSVGAMGVRNVYGIETKLLAQLELEMTDGTRKIVCTDGNWEWCNDGSLRFADMKDGEVCDLQKTPTYFGKARQAAHPVVPTASNNIPVVERERFTPIISRTPSGKFLLDFGQNIAGYVEVQISAHAGQALTLQFAEHLDDAGEIDMAAMQCRPGKPNATPKQEVSITFAEGQNCYKTKFAVFGFRYAVTRCDIELQPENITGIAVYSDMAQTGFFECSHPLINRFVENTLWSMKGNFLDVPTDCPTRERAPWTGDVQIFCKTGSYLMDTATFLRKWMLDMADRQGPDGNVPCHAPDVRNNEYFAGIDMIKRMDGCCGWADAMVLVPWRLYKIYDDEHFLTDSYAAMKAHVLFQIGRTNRTGLFGKSFPKPDKKYISNVGQAFGEWLEAKDVYQQSVVRDFIAPHPEEATAYLAYVCELMAEIAEICGHPEDTALYEEYRDGCKAAYLNQFIPMETNRQSKLVRPLALGLLNSTAEKEETFERLVASIEKRHYNIGTGFLSTPLILPLLSQMGRDDIAYRMMENEEEPGWLYEVKTGATTVWENWDGSASQNHYSPGSVCEWLFETVCGVRVAGENHFTIAPRPGGTLSFARFAYNSVYGKVACGWEKKDKKTTYTIAIPPNCTADIILPDGTQQVSVTGTKAYITDCV